MGTVCRVDIDEALAFLRSNHRAVIATTRADGTTQMSPITAGVDREGRVVVSSRETAYKVKHLRALPYAAVCAFTDGFFGEWLQVEGPVDVVPLPDAMEPSSTTTATSAASTPTGTTTGRRWSATGG